MISFFNFLTLFFHSKITSKWINVGKGDYFKSEEYCDIETIFEMLQNVNVWNRRIRLFYYFIPKNKTKEFCEVQLLFNCIVI